MAFKELGGYQEEEDSSDERVTKSWSLKSVFKQMVNEAGRNKRARHGKVLEKQDKEGVTLGARSKAEAQLQREFQGEFIRQTAWTQQAALSGYLPGEFFAAYEAESHAA